MEINEIIELVRKSAFWIHPDSTNIVYVNLDKLKENLSSHPSPKSLTPETERKLKSLFDIAVDNAGDKEHENMDFEQFLGVITSPQIQSILSEPLPQSKEDLEGIAEKLRDATQSIKLYFNCKYEFELDAKDIDMILEIYQDTFQSLPSQSLVKEIERKCEWITKEHRKYNSIKTSCGESMEEEDDENYSNVKYCWKCGGKVIRSLTFAGKSEVGK